MRKESPETETAAGLTREKRARMRRPRLLSVWARISHLDAPETAPGSERQHRLVGNAARNTASLFLRNERRRCGELAGVGAEEMGVKYGRLLARLTHT